MKKLLTRHAAVLFALTIIGQAEAETGFYRFPNAWHDTVVFTAEGDLWKVARSGGSAQRLTTHPAEESDARVSPDGQWIAFMASYDSAAEAYVMPIAGGSPKRLSFDGARIWLQGWTPNGEVLYASENVSGPFRRRVLRAVDPNTLQTRTLPLHDAHEAAYSADGKTLFFVRFGLQMTGDNARDYRGGAMAQLWKFQTGASTEATRVSADLNASISRPMVRGDRVYFVSDADGTQNLWSMRFDGSDRQQHTTHQTFDVRGASIGGDVIVYQNGADLWQFDIATGASSAINIELVSDFEQRRQRWLKTGSSFVTDAALAADGSSVTLTARGKVVVAAPGQLRRRDIAIPDAHRARAAVLSVDGKSVFAISDLSGNNEIWRFAADGSGAPKQLTHDGSTHRWRLYPSPDGHWLAHDDKRGQLWLLNLDTGENRKIDQGPKVGDDVYGNIRWSADSRYLALTRSNSSRALNQIHLYALANQQLTTLTSDRYDSYEPNFSPDGRWLYFLSDRNFAATPSAPWGDRNMGPMFDQRTKVYAYALQADQRFPFLPKDELTQSESADAGKSPASTEDAKAKPSTSTPANPAVQWAGLTDRLFEVPLPPGNYSRLAVDKKRLYVLDRGVGANAHPQLRTLTIGNQPPKPEVFAAELSDFRLSADGSKVLLITWRDTGFGDLFIVDAGDKAPSDMSSMQVRLADWILPITPHQEWQQMFADAWRMHRDFSFDPNMRGVDWNAVRQRYEVLLPRVTDRAELDDLLGQMTSELGILHSQVRGAEFRKDPDAAVTASLGAALEPASGGMLIRHIYRTEPELPSERGPLQQPGTDVREGDVIAAINGVPVRTAGDVAEQLHNQAGQQVLLDLRRGQAPRKQIVTPVAADRDATLRYSDWVQDTRTAVERVGQGRIGYLHLRAMGPNDIASFARDFYANYDRDGLIIDVRRNRGGNIDSWIIEKLLRRTWAFWQTDLSTPYWNMQQSFRGHLVVLIDPFTYSDGETFAAGIKSLGLGPLIGQRTAGAGIWLSDRNVLADNGVARVAESGQFRADGQWLIEGTGVSPDMPVENLPFESFNGRDRQLEAALDYLDRKLKAEPIAKPEALPIPKRGTPASDAIRLDQR
ncbi:peptidase S41 [Ahniella affigens]|uniref:Tricorn protease homolog n=1 Tax=Ahniella affigens TaxID=2021234 RepID=A0A2P1PUK5_9GAMM|nr:S41 family peptidase [Ahniella affigens]AVP98527.1 peptidase S41 [Ahniella affigens]